MNNRAFIFVFLILCCQACGHKEKEEQLARREQQIAKKEQTLMQWEQQLAVMEKELLQKKKKQLEDSTAITDSLHAQAVTGRWIVKMRCTETSCSGSAIGDSKTETWEISYEKGLIVNAFTGSELSRIYNGTFSENRLNAVNGQPGSESVMRVMLELKENKMEGMREVERSDCKIRYALTAERQK